MTERALLAAESIWPAFKALGPVRSHASPAQASPPEIRPWGDDVRAVLCIRLDNLGDVLMTSPAITLLRQAVPGRAVTLLAAPSGKAAASLLPDISDVIVHRPSWMPGAPDCTDPHAHAFSEEMLIADLKARRFDAAVIFTVYSQNPMPAAMLCYLAGIPRVLAHCRENPYGLISDWIAEPEPHNLVRHEVQRQVDLVRHVISMPEIRRLLVSPTAHDAAYEAPAMRLTIAPDTNLSLNNPLSRYGLDSTQPFLVVHVGATAGSRCYPLARFAASIDLLRQHLNWPIVLTGSKSDMPAVAQLFGSVTQSARNGLIDLSGALTLEELAALLARAALLLSNNSGPVHVAAACRTPVVVLYALTNPQHTPWRTPCRVLFHDVACRWCYRSVCPEGHHACLQGVDTEAVVSAVLSLLTETQAPVRAVPVLKDVSIAG